MTEKPLTVRDQVSFCKTCKRPFKRTLKQNAFLHAEPFPKLAKAMGLSVNQTKFVVMTTFWGWEPVTLRGVRLMVPVKVHTSDMTVAETNTFIDWLVPWAMEEHGVEIILPDEWRGEAA